MTSHKHCPECNEPSPIGSICTGAYLYRDSTFREQVEYKLQPATPPTHRHCYRCGIPVARCALPHTREFPDADCVTAICPPCVRIAFGPHTAEFVLGAANA